MVLSTIIRFVADLTLPHRAAFAPILGAAVFGAIWGVFDAVASRARNRKVVSIINATQNIKYVPEAEEPATE